MRIGILGTGSVGRALAEGFADGGHEVTIGTRDVDALMARSRERAELLVNATLGTASIDALGAAGAGRVDGRIVIDPSNPLDFSGEFPPSLFVGITDSLAERILRAFPGARVVKAWNTVTAPLMTNPTALTGATSSILAT
jgi:predicted dinucleotide-binding enzyme